VSHAGCGCGFYKEQGWGPNFVVPTHSRIDAPALQDGKFVQELRTGTSVHLRGIAFGAMTLRHSRVVADFTVHPQ